MPETWDGLVKRGFINEDSGIRFIQGIRLKEEDKFNKLAAKNGVLYNMVKKNNMPFYIDRLQGGSFIQDYPYDMNIVKDYCEELGENFWGFQMHEWMTNIYSDLSRIHKSNCPYIEGTLKWREEDIVNYILKAHPYKYVHLEAMNAKEYAEVGDIQNAEEYIAVAARLYEKRQKYTGGYLLPCDAGCQPYQIEFKNGTKRIMIEIGAQTSDTRFQFAYARGMAKAYNVQFGAYYEPWLSAVIDGKWVYSSCNYHKQGLNEWRLAGDGPYKTQGENGGSSRSMQRRMHLYSYIAGASFVSEEWGMCNTFYDWNDFEISPYVQIKLDFINFTQKYKDIGKIYTPIAIVLPEKLEMVEKIRSVDYHICCGFEASERLTELAKRIRPTLCRLFTETEEMIGTEKVSLVNNDFPDVFDVVHEDRFDSDSYEYLIDLTGNSKFAKKYSQKICDVNDVKPLLNKIMPCRVEGGLHHIVNKADNGCYYLMIFNHNGVVRTAEKGETTLKEVDKTVTVECKDNRSLAMLEGNSEIRCENGVNYITVPAGGWFFGRF